MSGDDRLRRGIRDLAALTALPSLCIGRTPDETLDILIDALPTALNCDLVLLRAPEPGAEERARLDGAALAPDVLAEVRALAAAGDDGASTELVVAGTRLWCLQADLPPAAHRGCLLAGRRSPLESETDRVLIRTAANLVATAMQTAHVLDVARRKDDFLAMLGHELRNPLAPIVTALDLLKQNPSARRETDVIERHAQHLSRIVDDLHDISRVTRGHVELRREYVSLASVLQRAVEIAAPLVHRARHQLDVGDAGAIALQGDPVRLVQVFSNLLTNAAKFTPPGGRIGVAIERTATRVRVTVHDTGVGIAPDQIQRIFEPFVQADRAPDHLSGGLGLGLAIVHNLVARHGGTIAARSDGRGLGATFAVELPALAATTAATAGVAPPPPRPTDARAQVRVLVVDDNYDVADLLSEALQGRGFQTAVANDGAEALTSWRTFQPHVGVFDVGLPDLDGYDVARAVRAEYGPQAVLIAVTGYGQPNDRTRSADAGFDLHLVKPVSVDELVRVLDQRVVDQRVVDHG